MHGPELFIDTTGIMFAKLVLAMCLGALLGTERAILARQAAGTRTYSLISMSAALFIITSNYVDSAYLGVVNFHPLQVAAAIITGIGFVGGGLIIFRGNNVHGATTAAGLWVAAGVGIAVGYGLYAIAAFATFLTLIVFTFMWYLENRFKQWFEDVHFEDIPGDKIVTKL